MTPGEAELARRELRLAEQVLEEATLLANARAAGGAASRLYYAVFHAARGALTVRGLHARTHSGQIALFRETFGVAPILAQLHALRVRADYGQETDAISLDEVGARAQEAEVFVRRCRSIVEDALARGPDEPDPPADS